jgi:hypothetical protein
MAKDEVFEETRPTNDAWTGMLAISLLALIVGCLLLFLDFSQYPSKDPGPVPKAQAPPAQGQPAQAPNAVPAPKK